MNVGERVGGKYRLLRQIGAGAMGTVWEAANEATSRRVAIKLLNRPSDDLRHRLLREARACGAIVHRNVIEIYDVGETDQGEPFLVMQLLEGETLADLLARQRRLSPAVAAHIGRDIARALAAAHEAHIIHRDLKPANVFLHQEAGTEGQVVKVLDFGVAKSLDANDPLVTIVGGAVGSPAYMSPEQIRAEKNLDPRTDLWSLGVVLFEMLAGVRPFPGGGQELLSRVLVGPIPRVSQVVRHVDASFDALVARCMERERERRMTSAVELAHALETFIGAEEGSRVHVGLAERALLGSVPDIGSHLDTTMPLPQQAAARSPSMPDAPASSLEVTVPLADAMPRVGKQGTLLTVGPSALPMTGPRGTALLGDVRARLEQAGAFAPPSSPTAAVTSTAAVVQPGPSSAAAASVMTSGAATSARPPRRGVVTAAAAIAGVLVIAAIGLAVGFSTMSGNAPAASTAPAAGDTAKAAADPVPNGIAAEVVTAAAHQAPAPTASPEASAQPTASPAPSGMTSRTAPPPVHVPAPKPSSTQAAPAGAKPSSGTKKPACTGGTFLKKCK
ncbi:serine/threonine-protein kinase [Polyangium aurulentum]|uniref:serine/threonine-protein kinase n=1 Tax=Polyangium aurulentum TaxID=2567896 RepID=UPI0010AE11F4|nr:serine/threonine-protein kinase [Polyangium aurulentum]UQA61378.1 protein kinase [Polyangium aurulentum]